ncbi:trehalose-phosphatase [Pseudomonas citronellolis]|uniref:trehalose-phosphatase n=1 Tax=Pseudomonas citronellolis TaxID=53408 RepID=UPI0023E4021D|nr:trehalose-phosphatase [Pseudomonas citronellolis]MDF3932537.1 trehalose-phosphatase [Pseudomonas citronellolis]
MSRPIDHGLVDAAIAPRGDASARALLEDWLSERHARCALFLDVDGTLLDIAETPDAVQVPEALRAALETLHRQLGGALALVSGRPLEQLDQLFAPLRLPASGGHGADWRLHADATPQHADAAPLPASLRERLRELARRHPGVLLEDKRNSLALHYRAVPAAGPALAAELERLLASAEGAALRLLPGKRVFELLAHAGDKAQAIRRLLQQEPFAGRQPLFIGDDVTDRPALALMPELGGLGLGVGQLPPGASAAFADARAVREALIQAARRARA